MKSHRLFLKVIILKKSLKTLFQQGPQALFKEITNKSLEGLQVNPTYQVFPESALAHKYCKGKGLEIGGSAHNPFGLNTLNVDITDSMNTIFKQEELRICGKALKVDLVASGDRIPLPNESQDFIVSSHLLEHFPNPIKALIEWDRLIRPGGIIFMIIPHQERTFDKARTRTTLQHLMEDFFNYPKTESHLPAGHEHCWITEDMVELIHWMMTNLHLKWEIIEVLDVDDKVGNGFCVVIRKLKKKGAASNQTSSLPDLLWENLLVFCCQIIYSEIISFSNKRLRGTLIKKSLEVLFKQGPRVLYNKIKEKLPLSIQYQSYLRNLKKSEVSDDIKRNEAKAFKYRPKISLIVPVFDTNKILLKLCIKSVLKQLYDHWELCIVDGGSGEPHVKKVLEEYAQRDKRINVKYLKENQGIVGNSNEALTMATGEFVGFLDHDDELAPEALYEVVKLLNHKPDLDFIYTDEDQITVGGHRLAPFFKPDWSPDFLYSCNYITHFSVIRKAIIDHLGGFQAGLDGSQDYDLFLRVLERTQKVAHIPKILYHWRIHPGSAAGSSTIKAYAYTAAKKALQNSLDRRNIKAEVMDGPFLGTYRVKYKIIDKPKVSIILPVRNEGKFLRQCLGSILEKTEYDNFEFWIIDHQGSASDISWLNQAIKTRSRIRPIKYHQPFSYSKIYNHALSLIDAEYCLFMSDQAEIISGEWLTAMLEHVQREEVGIAGALLYYPENTIQHAGVIIGIEGLAGYSHRQALRNNHLIRVQTIQNLSAVSGTCMMTKKRALEKVGCFDEFFQDYFYDIDLCLKLREHGYLVVYTPYAQLFNYEFANQKHNRTVEKSTYWEIEAAYFQKKWSEVLVKGDPYYNPNLTLEREDFSIRKNPKPAGYLNHKILL